MRASAVPRRSALSRSVRAGLSPAPPAWVPHLLRPVPSRASPRPPASARRRRRSGFAGELSDLADGIDWMTPCCRGCRLRRRSGRRIGGGCRLRGRCGHFLRRNDAKGREAQDHQSCDYADYEAHYNPLNASCLHTHNPWCPHALCHNALNSFKQRGNLGREKAKSANEVSGGGAATAERSNAPLAGWARGRRQTLTMCAQLCAPVGISGSALNCEIDVSR